MAIGDWLSVGRRIGLKMHRRHTGRETNREEGVKAAAVCGNVVRSAPASTVPAATCRGRVTICQRSDSRSVWSAWSLLPLSNCPAPCSRFRITRALRQRQQAGHTPSASRSSVAARPRCALRVSALSSPSAPPLVLLARDYFGLFWQRLCYYGTLGWRVCCELPRRPAR